MPKVLFFRTVQVLNDSGETRMTAYLMQDTLCLKACLILGEMLAAHPMKNITYQSFILVGGVSFNFLDLGNRVYFEVYKWIA